MRIQPPAKPGPSEPPAIVQALAALALLLIPIGWAVIL